MEHSSRVKHIDPQMGYYIAGFADGEGSFNVSIKKQDDFRQGWKISASFNISQKDRVILALIKKVLGCGTLRERNDGVVYYEVTNIRSLQETIIPFFTRFSFLSANKKKNFAIFRSIVEALAHGEQRTSSGLHHILYLREQLNIGHGRKRKYQLSDVFPRGSSETIRKTRKTNVKI